MGTNLVLVVFAVVVIGGMGSILGSVVTGFGEGILEVSRWSLWGARDLAGPSTEASKELLRPLLGRLQDDAAALLTNHNLSLTLRLLL